MLLILYLKKNGIVQKILSEKTNMTVILLPHERSIRI